MKFLTTFLSSVYFSCPVNSNLSVINTVNQYKVGSSSQHLVAGDNDLVTETQLPAGIYLFIVNGVHETSNMQYIIDDIYTLARDGAVRQYYGGACPGMSMMCAMQVNDNPNIGVRIRMSIECTTYSEWVIQAIRLK